MLFDWLCGTIRDRDIRRPSIDVLLLILETIGAMIFTVEAETQKEPAETAECLRHGLTTEEKKQKGETVVSLQ
jgi:hypothetical protein